MTLNQNPKGVGIPSAQSMNPQGMANPGQNPVQGLPPIMPPNMQGAPGQFLPPQGGMMPPPGMMAPPGMMMAPPGMMMPPPGQGMPPGMPPPGPGMPPNNNNQGPAGP